MSLIFNSAVTRQPASKPGYQLRHDSLSLQKSPKISCIAPGWRQMCFFFFFFKWSIIDHLLSESRRKWENKHTTNRMMCVSVHRYPEQWIGLSEAGGADHKCNHECTRTSPPPAGNTKLATHSWGFSKLWLLMHMFEKLRRRVRAEVCSSAPTHAPGVRVNLESVCLRQCCLATQAD